METLSTSIKGKYCINNTYYVATVPYEVFPIPSMTSHRDSPVYQYTMDGQFIRGWNSVKEAMKNFDTTVNIYKAIRTGGSSGGFQWSWDKVPSMKKLETKTQARKVGKYTKDGELVQVFDTVREAKVDTCGAPNVLSGRRKTAGGFIFKYIE